jgi:hypothetical protein
MGRHCQQITASFPEFRHNLRILLNTILFQVATINALELFIVLGLET